MRSILFIGASALISIVSVEAKHVHGAHQHLEEIHRRHRQERELARQVNETLEKRAATCAFPTNAGLVAVTPECGNGGWAFAPDQQCTPGRYCPYACPSGQVSMQWDPSVTSYVYPGSRNGGLLCNSDGTVSKPFPNNPYCQTTNTNIGVQNNCGTNVAFCQTVLPGDEDMLIPTDVTSWTALAVPGPTYWAETAAHYYINPPGVSTVEGCVWGSTANPYGNWAPYVAGANAVQSGETFIKLGWNPIYLQTTTPFRNEMPTWGVSIECPNGGCNGLPCSIDPSVNGVNEMTGSATAGAGGGTFCVVTVAAGSNANFIVFESSGNGTSSPVESQSQWLPESSIPVSAPASSQTSSEWSGWGQAGQFYPGRPVSGVSNISSPATSTAWAPAPTVTSNPASWASWPSTETSDNTADEAGPTGEPYYLLFNSSEPTTSTDLPILATNTLIAQHTGSASHIGASCGLLVFALSAIFL